MNTRFWGPSGWLFLHTITSLYPNKPTLTNKITMRNFMILLTDILPCKYCRASFNKYHTSLNINKYLQNNIQLQLWLYKMHNKVNNKLKKQGFCNNENPHFNSILEKYDTKNIDNIINNIIHPNKSNKKLLRNIKILRFKEIITNVKNYIYKLGNPFLGSIIFNYQSYYANCHTTSEKHKIIYIYNQFFNQLDNLLAQLIIKRINSLGYRLNQTRKQTYNTYNINKILKQNEPYNKIKVWYFKTFNINLSYDDYEKYFNKHIINSCNKPKKLIKTCRKLKTSSTSKSFSTTLSQQN